MNVAVQIHPQRVYTREAAGFRWRRKHELKIERGRDCSSKIQRPFIRAGRALLLLLLLPIREAL